MPPDLSPRAYQALRALVLGNKLDEIPEELLSMKLAKAEKLRKQPDLLRLVWVPTREGRIVIAQQEGLDDDPPPQPEKGDKGEDG